MLCKPSALYNFISHRYKILLFALLDKIKLLIHVLKAVDQVGRSKGSVSKKAKQITDHLFTGGQFLVSKQGVDFCVGKLFANYTILLLFLAAFAIVRQIIWLSDYTGIDRLAVISK